MSDDENSSRSLYSSQNPEGMNLEPNSKHLNIILSKSYQLSVSIDSAEMLQQRLQMESNFSVLVLFGDVVAQTKTIKSSFTPEWQEKLFLAVLPPIPSSPITIQVLLEHLHKRPQVFDEFSIDFSHLIESALKPSWFFLYTGPLRSVYAGRILLSASAVPSETPINSTIPEKKVPMPRTRQYILWFEIIEVAGLNIKDNLRLRIEIGSQACETRGVSGEKQRWLWEKYAVVPEKLFSLPEESREMPKVLVKVISEERDMCLCLAEYVGRELVEKGSRPAVPTWTQFRSIPEVGLDYLGFGLFRINIIPVGNLEYLRPGPYLMKYGMFEVRALVYQAQGIRISDVLGLSDPFVTISVNGVSKSTKIEKQCLNPHWLEVLAWRTNLNTELKLCNSLQIDMWNWNEPPEQIEHIGTCNVPLCEISKEVLPKPTWYHCRGNTQDRPKVLISFVLYKLINKDHSIQPINLKNVTGMIKIRIVVLLIGIRNVIREFLYKDTASFLRISMGNAASIDTKDSYRGEKESPHRNFIEVLEVELQTQRDPKFAPSIVFKAIEKGAYNSEILIGAANVKLGKYLPWALNNNEDDEKSRTKITKTSNYTQNLTQLTEINEGTDTFEESKNKTKSRKGNTNIFEDTVDINLEFGEGNLDIPITKWPRYKRKDFSRQLINATFEEIYGTDLPYEKFPLTYMTTADTLQKSGDIQFVIKIPRDTESNPLANILESFKSSETLYARFYIYDVKNLNTQGESPQVYIWLSSNESDTEHQHTSQLFPSNSPSIMKCYTLTILLPAYSSIRLSFWNKKLHTDDELLGFYDFDIESRWFNPEYQRLKNLGVENIPIETIKLSNPESTVTLCLEILSQEEYKKVPQEILTPQFQSTFELRLVIWKVKHIKANGKARDISIQVFFADNKYERETTDTHKNAVDSAEFNWRLKFSVVLPCRDPLLCFEFFDGKTDKVFGYLNLDLGDFFVDIHKSLVREKLDRVWMDFFEEKGGSLGKVEVECSMMLMEEADENPVGRGRAVPNKDPPLHAPGSGRDFEEIQNEIERNKEKHIEGKNRYKKYIAMMCCVIIFIIIPVVVFSLQ